VKCTEVARSFAYFGSMLSCKGRRERKQGEVGKCGGREGEGRPPTGTSRGSISRNGGKGLFGKERSELPKMGACTDVNALVW